MEDQVIAPIDASTPSEDRDRISPIDQLAPAISEVSTATEGPVDCINILENANNTEDSHQVSSAPASSPRANSGGSSEKQQLVTADIRLTTPQGKTTLLSLESPTSGTDLSSHSLKPTSEGSHEQVFPRTPPRLPARPSIKEHKVEALPPTPPIISARPKNYRKRSRTREPRSIQAMVTAKKSKSQKPSSERIGRDGQHGIVLPISLQSQNSTGKDAGAPKTLLPLEVESKLDAPVQSTRSAIGADKAQALCECDTAESCIVTLARPEATESDNREGCSPSSEEPETAQHPPSSSSRNILTSTPSPQPYPRGQFPLPPVPRAFISPSNEYGKVAVLPIRLPPYSDSN
jgi:hypothetical protein